MEHIENIQEVELLSEHSEHFKDVLRQALLQSLNAPSFTEIGLESHSQSK